tara:strand:+ start:24 stop:491 length:468 start_codon:yes stop_codon:yes gene_type:complete
LESRKYHLQTQIIEALKANDNDLYSLLKSQWAHRFGVESLEELKNLDLAQLNQNPNNLNNQEIDSSKENSFEGDKEINVKIYNDQEKEIKTKEFESIDDKSDESLKMKSYTIVGKESDENKAIKPFKDNKTHPEVKALIPLPPKPKYSYLKKWLL